MKILIVDDEPLVREYLIACISACAGDFVLTGWAADGSEALKRIEAEQPDVVFTDITMPDMDGLTLAAKMQDCCPSVDVVILTCHPDFEYTRQAMKCGAKDYLLKSEITPQSMHEFLCSLDQAHAEKRRKDPVRTLLSISELFCRILNGEVKRISQELAASYGLDLENHAYFCILLMRNDAILESLREIRFTGLHSLSLYLPDSSRLLLLARVDPHMSGQKKAAVRCHLLQILKGEPHVGAVGTSLVHYHTATLTTAVMEMAADYWAAFYRAPVPPSAAPMSVHDPQLDDLAKQAISFSSAGQYSAFLQTMKNLLDYSTERKPDVFLLKQTFRLVLNSCPLPREHTFINRASRMLCNAGNYGEFHAILLRFLEEFPEHARLYSPPIQQALQYISEHYQEDISLNDVGSAVFLQVKYLSRLFKKEVGIGFSEYLLSTRMHIAHRLLLTTDLKIHQISETVGFSNISYFSQAFKKTFGQTPNEIRKAERG